MAVNPRVNLCLLAVRSIAVCALVAQCLTPARAADALPVKEPADQATQAQKPAYAPQGRQMQRYKAFARQAEMPAITATDKTTLEVGGTVKTDVNRLAQLSSTEKEALAGQFGVPAGVIAKAAGTRLEQPTAECRRSSLRTFARRLLITGSCKVSGGDTLRRRKARRSRPMRFRPCRAGDIGKAWELYDGLQKPAPPANLRVIVQP